MILRSQRSVLSRWSLDQRRCYDRKIMTEESVLASVLFRLVTCLLRAASVGPYFGATYALGFVRPRIAGRAAD